MGCCDPAWRFSEAKKKMFILPSTPQSTASDVHEARCWPWHHSELQEPPAALLSELPLESRSEIPKDKEKLADNMED